MQQRWIRIMGQTTIFVAILLFTTFSVPRAQIRMVNLAPHDRTIQQPAVHPTKTTPKAVSAPHPQPSKSKAAKALPRLVVAKIWLDSRNSIHCTLKNQGKGFLSIADHGRGKLKISCCRQVKILDLKNVDPKHALLRPHGQISLNTHINMACTDRVEAKIFFTGKFPGHIVRNSRLTVKLQPKPISKITKANSRKAFHTQSALQAQLSKKPQLHIQKIYLKKGTIHIRIRENGFGRLSEKDYEQGRVVLYYSGKTKSWRLKNVDPGGKLNGPGKEVLFDTGINVNKTGVVRVSIEKVRMHPVKTVRLSPEKALQTHLSALPGTQTAAGMVSAVKTRYKMQPEVFVEKIYFKNGRIHLLIKNKGRGKISSGDYRQGKMVLQYGGKTRAWHIRDVDPMRHLDRRDGSVDFNTNLPPKPKSDNKVKVTFYDYKNMKMAAYNIAVLPPASSLTKLQARKPGGDRFGKPQPPVKKSTLPPGLPGRVLMPTPDGGDIGTPPVAKAILAITQLSLSPGEPAKNTSATVDVTIRNRGPLDMPYRCNCSVVTMTSDRFGTRGSWGEPRLIVSANEANVPLVSPNTGLTIHIPVQFAEAGYHIVVAQLHVDAGHLCQTEESAQQVAVDTSAQIKTLVADIRGETPQMDLVLSEVRRDQGRLYLTMYSQGQLGTTIPNEDWNGSTLTVRIEQVWTGPSPAATMISARISDIDPHGMLRIPWAFGHPPAMRLHYVWPTRASAPTFGLDPDDLAGNRVRVELNANRSIPEINYSNNIKEETFPPGPDLKPDLVVCMPKYVFLHPPVTYHFPIWVKNIGKAANAPGGEVMLEVSGHEYKRIPVPVLQSGEKKKVGEVKYIWGNHGTNHFTITVDDLDRILETVQGEQNNVLRGLIDRNDYHSEDYDTFNATHPNFCSDAFEAATPVP